MVRYRGGERIPTSSTLMRPSSQWQVEQQEEEGQLHHSRTSWGVHLHHRAQVSPLHKGCYNPMQWCLYRHFWWNYRNLSIKGEGKRQKPYYVRKPAWYTEQWYQNTNRWVILGEKPRQVQSDPSNRPEKHERMIRRQKVMVAKPKAKRE